MAKAPLSPQRAGIRLLKLWRATMGAGTPVDVVSLALEWSRQVAPEGPIGEIKPEEIDGFEGGLFWLPTRRIWALLYHPRHGVTGRANFTIGHELGHFALHRHLSEAFRCSQGGTLGVGSGVNASREREADVFASYLLMPIDDFDAYTAGRKIDLDLLSECANRYSVSLTAATLKWLEFTRRAAVLVVSREGIIEWWRSSASAEKISFANLRRGQEIPLESMAAAPAGQFSNTALRDGIYTPKGMWFADCGAQEMHLISDRFDMTISLLMLDAPAISDDEADVVDLIPDRPRFR